MRQLLILTVIISLNLFGQMNVLEHSKKIMERTVASISVKNSNKSMTLKRKLSENRAMKVKETLLRLQISKNAPKLSTDATHRLVTAFLQAERIYKVPARLLSAFAFVESGYRLNAFNNRTLDYGIMQVNMYNIQAHKMDKNRLVTDLQYSVNNGAHVLTWFLSKYNTHEAIKRYNCGVRKHCVMHKYAVQYKERILAAL